MAGLCGWALSFSCPPLGRAPELCQLCGWALFFSCLPLGRAPELCQLCGWALWVGSVAWPCPFLVLLLAAPLNSVNSVWLSSSCPPLGRAPELCQLCCWALSIALLLAAPLDSVAGPCGWALSSSWPVNSVAGLCGWALSSSWLGLVLLLSSSWPRP